MYHSNKAVKVLANSSLRSWGISRASAYVAVNVSGEATWRLVRSRIEFRSRLLRSRISSWVGRKENGGSAHESRQLGRPRQQKDMRVHMILSPIITWDTQRFSKGALHDTFACTFFWLVSVLPNATLKRGAVQSFGEGRGRGRAKKWFAILWTVDFVCSIGSRLLPQAERESFDIQGRFRSYRFGLCARKVTEVEKCHLYDL